MKRFVSFTLIACVLACGFTCAASPFARGPYSGAPATDSVVISWLVVPSLPATLEVAPVLAGPQTGSRTIRLSVAAPAEDRDGQVDVLVDGLAPATSYVYRITVQSGPEIASSPVGHFRTAPLAGDRAAFAVLADTQWQWEGANRLAVVGNAIAFDAAQRGLDFILHAGDLVETPNAHYWPHWFASFESMLLAASFVPVLGNHEKNSVSYYNAFAHPAGGGQNDERWWTLRWGDVVIVGLDTAATRADRILEQQAYARAQLAGPERWKFVIFHHPVFSSDAYHGSGYGYETIYHPIFVESGVDIVFNGHAHNYERIEKDGVVYLVLGGGGAVPRGLAPERVEGSVVAIENRNFYARVATTSEEVRVEVVSVAEATEATFAPTAGELLDAFALSAPAQPAPVQPEAAMASLPVSPPDSPPDSPPQLPTPRAQLTTETVSAPAAPCEPVASVTSEMPAVPSEPAKAPAVPAPEPTAVPAAVEAAPGVGVPLAVWLALLALAAVALLALR